MFLLQIYFLSGLILVLLILLGGFVSAFALQKQEKITMFECGVFPSSKSRGPFSIRFFLITILFLIFDVELMLLVPVASIETSDDFFFFFYVGLIFFLILARLLYE